MLCRHCNQRHVNRPRGLCWHCYYQPGVKDLYACKPGSPGAANYFGGTQLPDSPTRYAPGTLGKVAVLTERFARRENLWHPLDEAGETGRSPADLASPGAAHGKRAPLLELPEGLDLTDDLRTNILTLLAVVRVPSVRQLGILLHACDTSVYRVAGKLLEEGRIVREEGGLTLAS